MKALSLTQPWASLVAIGAKRIETRSWSTAYRGPIAIHAAARFPKPCRELCLQVPFYGVLTRKGLERLEDVLPLGAVVAIGQLVDVVPTTHPSLTPTTQEVAFGDFSPARYAWLLSNVLALHRPIPCKGALGLWHVPSFVERDPHFVYTAGAVVA